MNFRNFWLDSCFGTTNSESINVTFKGGQSADYTMDIFGLLASDPSVIEIVSNETGELYFCINEDGEREITI